MANPHALLLLLCLPLVLTTPAPASKHVPGQCRWDFGKIFKGNFAECKEDPSNTHSQGISLELLHDIHLMAEYAAAAYAPINSNSTGTPIICSGAFCPGVAAPEGNCPQVEAAKAQTLEEFADTERFDDHGFIAVDPENELIVLSFRGTQSFKNWVQDLKILRDPPLGKTEWCEDSCHVHHGFWEMWTQIAGVVLSNVKKARELPGQSDYRFIVTGHSLGGALATIAATEFRRLDDWYLKHTELFSFGSPRLGEKGSVRYMSQLSNLSYRVTAAGDPIVRLPPSPYGGYLHTSPEYFISQNPMDPSPEDFIVATGSYTNVGANNPKFKGFPMRNHTHYFGWMSGCGADHKKPERNSNAEAKDRGQG